MRIPVFDPTVQHRRLLPELQAAIREVLLNDQSDVVPQVAGLEQEVADLLGRRPDVAQVHRRAVGAGAQRITR